MNSRDIDYCLQRAEQERLRSRVATTPEAASIHRQFSERYLERVRTTVTPSLFARAAT